MAFGLIGALAALGIEPAGPVVELVDPTPAPMGIAPLAFGEPVVTPWPQAPGASASYQQPVGASGSAQPISAVAPARAIVRPTAATGFMPRDSVTQGVSSASRWRAAGSSTPAEQQLVADEPVASVDDANSGTGIVWRSVHKTTGSYTSQPVGHADGAKQLGPSLIDAWTSAAGIQPRPLGNINEPANSEPDTAVLVPPVEKGTFPPSFPTPATGIQGLQARKIGFQEPDEVEPAIGDSSACSSCSLDGQCGTGVQCDLPCRTSPCRWTAGIEALTLHRSRPQGQERLIECNCIEGLFFSAWDAAVDWGAGWRTSFGRTNDCGLDFEIEYFAIRDWVFDGSFGGDLTVLGSNIGTGTANARYVSQLQSIELKTSYNWDCWTNLFAGFRFVELDELASITGQGNLGSVNQSVTTFNSLAGFQIGAERSLFDQGGCLTVDSTAKAGVYNNQIVRRQSGDLTGRQTEDRTSVLVEFDMVAKLQVSRHCYLTGGYQVLWIDGVALAIEQFASPGQINSTGSPFYHGVTAGLELVW